MQTLANRCHLPPTLGRPRSKVSVAVGMGKQGSVTDPCSF